MLPVRRLSMSSGVRKGILRVCCALLYSALLCHALPCVAITPEAVEAACCINGTGVIRASGDLRDSSKLVRNLALALFIPPEAVEAANSINGTSVTRVRGPYEMLSMYSRCSM